MADAGVLYSLCVVYHNKRRLYLFIDRALAEPDADPFARMSEIATATEIVPRQALSVPVRALLWAAGFALAFWLCIQWTATTPVHNDFTQNVWLPSRLALDG